MWQLCRHPQLSRLKYWQLRNLLKLLLERDISHRANIHRGYQHWKEYFANILCRYCVSYRQKLLPRHIKAIVSMTQEHARETCANWNWAHTFHLPLVFIVRKYLVLRWVTKSSHVLKNYDEPPEKIAPHTRQKTQVSVKNLLEWKKKCFEEVL